MATQRPLELNLSQDSQHVDEADIIAYSDGDDVYCLACARDQLGETQDDAPVIPDHARPIHTDDAHPPVGVTCTVCNEQIVEPIWYSPALYTIKLTNSDDDPTQILAVVRGAFAKQWGEFHGALAGGTWECADGPTFIYDTLSFEPSLVENLEAEGFDLDLSEYSDPDERDIAIATHAANREACSYDRHRAEKHLHASSSGSA